MHVIFLSLYILLFCNLFTSLWHRFNEPLAYIFNFFVMKPITEEIIIVLVVLTILLRYPFLKHSPSDFNWIYLVL